MSHNIIQFDALDRKLAKNLSSLHNNQVQSAIDSIKSNLNTHSIEILRPFVFNAVCAPEMLTRMTDFELYEIWDAINDEIKFRKEERHA